jgi:hypothetical protein
MTTDTSREDAVHHIDTTSDSLHHIFRRTDSHEIVRLLSWKEWLEDIEDAIHVFLRLSY